MSSSYAGDFCVSGLAEVRELVLFAAGTGFTPMAALMAHCYAEADGLTRFVLLTHMIQFIGQWLVGVAQWKNVSL